MTHLNRKQLQRMILKEFKMMGMSELQPAGKIGAFSHDHDDMMSDHGFVDDDMGEMHSAETYMSGKGSVSKEDCCAAVMCLIECCSCPATKQALMECCQDIMSGHYDK